MDYRNMDMELFDYSKKRNVERFRVRVEASPTLDQKISEAASVRIPKGFRDRLRALEGRSLTAAEIRTVGETIGQILFPGSLPDAVIDNLNHIGNDQGLRIRLKLDSFALADLPWSTPGCKSSSRLVSWPSTAESPWCATSRFQEPRPT